jgi:hypothetical protein
MIAMLFLNIGKKLHYSLRNDTEERSSVLNV